MKFFLKIFSLCLALLMLLSAVGCGSNSGDAFIYFELDEKPSTLDPQLVQTRVEAVIVRSIFDTLLRYDEDGDIVPSACSDYSVSSLTYTFYIKEDAKWTNGDELTSYDFEFGLERALDPELEAPAAATLKAISKISTPDSKTLVITLSEDDPDFLHTLTTPVSMPCNEEFFDSAKGRYGLELDYTPACGSYYIRKWNDKDKFLIRLAKNLDYKGDFEARNMRVYFTCDERSNLTMLREADTDFAYLSAEEAKNAAKENISLSLSEDQTGILFINPSLSDDIRSALSHSIKNSADYYDKLYGVRVADSIAPAVLNPNGSISVDRFYNLSLAQSSYADALKKDPEASLNGKKILCHSSPAAVTAAKAIAAHWQKNLGAIINIEEVSSLSALRGAYQSGDYTLIVMPFTAFFNHRGVYLSKFKTDKTTIEAAEAELTSASYCYPLYSESSFTAHLSYIENADKISYGGVPDLALAIKSE